MALCLRNKSNTREKQIECRKRNHNVVLVGLNGIFNLYKRMLRLMLNNPKQTECFRACVCTFYLVENNCYINKT